MYIIYIFIYHYLGFLSAKTGCHRHVNMVTRLLNPKAMMTTG